MNGLWATTRIISFLLAFVLACLIAPAAEGDPDLSFGTGGRTTASQTSYGSPAEAWALAIQPDGKIVVAGRFGNHIGVVRFLPGGALDPDFGAAGKKVVPLNGQALARGVAIQPDGKIVVVGKLSETGVLGHAGVVIRLNPNGVPDETFGSSSNGIVTFRYLTPAYPTYKFWVQLNAVALKPDGKIVVAGYVNYTEAIYNYQQFLVGQFLPDGTPDTSFSSDGLQATAMGTSCGYQGSQAHAVAIQSDGKIVLAGFAVVECPSRVVFALTRYLPNGALDTSLDADGILTRTNSNAAPRDGFSGVRGLSVQADGSILAAGTVGSNSPIEPHYRVGVARYNSVGIPDPNFGTDGLALAAPPAPYQDQGASAFGMAVQPDGKILVAGEAGTTNPGSGGWDVAIARFTREGTLDPTFGSGGWSLTVASGPDTINAIALQADGRIVVAGTVGSEILVARYHGAATGPAFGVSRVYPTTGGRDGTVTMTVQGLLLQPGASVLLRRAGAPDIPATTATVAPGGQSLAARFDFNAAATGPWDVVVTNPGGATASLPRGFTIAPTVQAFGVVTVLGPPRMRPQKYTFYVNWTNIGNVDGPIPIVLKIRSRAAVNLGVSIYHGPLIPLDPSYPFPSDMPWRRDVPAPDDPNFTLTTIPLVIYAPAGGTGSFPVEVNHCETEIKAVSGPALTLQCVQAMNEALLGMMLGDCLNVSYNLIKNALAAHHQGEAVTWASLMANTELSAAKCALQVIPVGRFKQVMEAVLKGLEALDAFNTVVGLLDACGLLGPANGVSGQCVMSRDPNDKYGPAGGGAARYMRSTDPLAYSIAFENLATATAPAQEVVITDALNASRMDLDTFALGPISFGNRLVSPPPGLQSFTQDIDLRPATNLIARIEATLDKPAAVARWRFRSIDPATGNPTTDPLAGFLPPNVTPPQGQGAVMFTVRPRQPIETGTQIQNQASIVFDTNAPILTPVWTNTIDDSKPTSAVAPLAAYHQSAEFTVAWSGADTGAGVAAYNVYVSENGAPSKLWQPMTSATQAMFTGEGGRTYAFYSVAVDRAGNREDAPAVPDAVTTINRPPVANAGLGQRIACTGYTGAAVTLNGSGSDPDGDPLSYQWRNAAGSVVASTASANLTLSVGTHRFTLLVSDGKGGTASASVEVTVVDTVAPVLTLALSPIVLWPPNHQLVDVTAQLKVVDTCDPNVVVTLVSVTSNEPDNGLGDGDTAGDIQGATLGTDDRAFQLRAERSGQGSGRVYTVVYRARDASANASTASGEVRVPKNR